MPTTPYSGKLFAGPTSRLGLPYMCQNGAVRRYAAVIGLVLLLTGGCLAQPASWRVERRESMLVAPLATQVKYVDIPGLDEELTYIVEEPYPATDFLAFLREDLKRKNWKPLPYYPGQPNTPSSHMTGWSRFGVDGSEVPRPEYRWLASWEDENHDIVGYWLQYTNSEKEHYLRTLHVEATYIPAKTAAQLAAEKGPPSRLKPSGLREIMRIEGGIYAVEDRDTGIGIWLFVMSTLVIGGGTLVWAWLSSVPAWLAGEPGTSRASLYAYTASVFLGVVPIFPLPESWMEWHHLLWRFISLAAISASVALLLVTVLLSWRRPSLNKAGPTILSVINLLLFTSLHLRHMRQPDDCFLGAEVYPSSRILPLLSSLLRVGDSGDIPWKSHFE